MLDAATERFVDQATALPPESLAEAYDRTLDLRSQGGKEASGLAVPSASQNSQLDRRIRAALLPRASTLDGHLIGLHSDAIAAVGIAARAVLRRAKLADEAYDVLVEPFRGLGVPIPERAETID
ncbi:hypothetical protein [Agromyces salentinus]|uniref:DUF222 domain-containing protein n=1 Tax=Agromyces salentinus TaxID=269421 RepID=A0ABN2MZN9_9MICO|nr:hypothetical protein [Agromyces salentinus]